MRVLDRRGRRWFVTADRISDKPGFGLDANGTEAALLAAYSTSAALRDGGLEFVAAPVATDEGMLLAYPPPDWCLAVFAHIDGQTSGADTWVSEADPAEAASLIGRLHSAAPLSTTQRWSGAVPSRRLLEDALLALDVPWATGPYAEPTRHALNDARTTVETQLARYDRLQAKVIAMSGHWVTTHGEPHQANFIKSPNGNLHLIDWDTARLAPRERDVWMLMGSNDSALNAYRATAGDYTPSPQAIALFDLLWQLTDLSIYVRRFREPHANGQDDAKSFLGIEQTLTWLAELPVS